MTVMYLGNNQWDFIFSDGKEVRLKEQHLRELFEGGGELINCPKEKVDGKILEESCQKQPCSKDDS